MLDTVHVLTGLTIGKYVQNPIVAFLLGIVSHYVLDWLPHWDGEKVANSKVQIADSRGRGLTDQGKKILRIDMLVTTAIFLILLITGELCPDISFIHKLPFSASGGSALGGAISNLLLACPLGHLSWWTGILGALFPDVLLLGYLFFGWEKPKWLFQIEFHKRIQTRKMKKIPGLVMQGWIIVLFTLLFLI